MKISVKALIPLSISLITQVHATQLALSSVPHVLSDLFCSIWVTLSKIRHAFARLNVANTFPDVGVTFTEIRENPSIARDICSEILNDLEISRTTGISTIGLKV